MKVSIIVAVLNSHTIVERQIRHFAKMPLPDEAELIIMDDGSEPPLRAPDCAPKNFAIHATHDTRLWTQGLARMAGARLAQGEYLFFTDIDHIIPKDTIEACLAFTEDKMVFRREFALLSEDGDILQDAELLLDFGLSKHIFRRRKFRAGVHGNTFMIRKSVWFEIGEYSHVRAESQKHTMGEDREFNQRWGHAVQKGKYKLESFGPKIFVYPVGRFREDQDVNPFGLFHNSYRDDLDDLAKCIRKA